MSVPTFIVGSGRCGSTMLSNMLREHPHVLSLSEFFSLVADLAREPAPFSSEPMDGRRFWAIVAAITPWISFALRHGVTSAEWLYHGDAPGAAFTLQTGVPAILITTLPHITDDHDRLFDVLNDEVNSWPEATIREHYQHLFSWLAERFGKRLCVERSGGGLLMTAQLLETFPDARFVHIVRDGRDAAASMREHPVIQFALVMSSIEKFLGADPITSSERGRIDHIPTDLRDFLPERFDRNAFAEFRLPLLFYGAFWAQQIESGMKVMGALPADRVLTLRYEDFFTSPKPQLDTLAAFLGEDYVDDAWSTRCAATVRKPKSTWRDLPEEAARELTGACRPGFDLLREVGVHYDV